MHLEVEHDIVPGVPDGCCGESLPPEVPDHDLQAQAQEHCKATQLARLVHHTGGTRSNATKAPVSRTLL